MKHSTLFLLIITLLSSLFLTTAQALKPGNANCSRSWTHADASLKFMLKTGMRNSLNGWFTSTKREPGSCMGVVKSAARNWLHGHTCYVLYIKPQDMKRLKDFHEDRFLPILKTKGRISDGYRAKKIRCKTYETWTGQEY